MNQTTELILIKSRTESVLIVKEHSPQCFCRSTEDK